jgi:cytochrome d ubiquinol oxidase subunit I
VQNGVEMPGLRTSDGLSESVTAGQVLWSIIMFGLIYALLFVVWIYVLNSKIQHGPDEAARRAHGLHDRGQGPRRAGRG